MGNEVYFMTLKEGGGPIKIGCSYRPLDRLDACNAWSPYALKIIYSFSGGFEIERRLHCHFADHHSHFEWFFPAREIYGFIDAHKAGADFDELIPPLKKAMGARRISLSKKPPSYKEYISYRTKLGHAMTAADRYDYWGDNRARKSAELSLSILNRWGKYKRYCADRPSYTLLEWVDRVAHHLKITSQQYQTSKS